MRSSARKFVAPMAIASLALAALTACGDGDNDQPDAPEEVQEEEPEAETEDEDADEPEEDVAEEPEDDVEEESADDGASADGGSAASWANPVTTDGELLGTIEVGDITVEVYQVAQDQATRSSIWADPDTEEPIVSEGDDVIVLNYVVTNNGDPVTLNNALVEVGFGYDTWPFMQQPSVADHDLLESYGVNDNGINSDSLGEDAYVLDSGEQYSVGEVMLHQPGEAFTIGAEVIERDDEGERTGDSQEGELTGTIE